MSCRRSLALAITVLTLALSTSACSASAQDDESTTSGSAIVENHVDVADVNAVIAKLGRLRNADPIGRYYEDGARIEGCWRNPAGNKLTDLKKALYCSMPLEFRLCNTVVLLSTDETKAAERYQGYLDCQKKVDAVFGGKGLFTFDADVNAMYQALYLEGATLSASDTASVVAENKPAFSDRSFPIVLLAIGRSLAAEAVDLAARGLSSMADDFKTASGDDPR